MLDAVRPMVVEAGLHMAPVALVEQGRVAIGDEIGAALEATLVAVLIGERPGLTTPDSLGVYLTWAPRLGRSDAERNCLSNVRPAGLPYSEAARRLFHLCRAARRLKLTGVGLKDDSQAALLLANQVGRFS
jgi:ethanolamine ammonia-lyase small subunit